MESSGQRRGAHMTLSAHRRPLAAKVGEAGDKGGCGCRWEAMG